MSVVELKEIVKNIKARDGTWCAKKPRCMNYPKCPQSVKSIEEIEKDLGPFKWWAVLEVFDIVAQEKQKHEEHPKWSRDMCRNSRYWQKGVRKRLLKKSKLFQASLKKTIMDGTVLLEIPERHGIDVVLTMAKVGVKFEWGINAKKIIKVMFVGKQIQPEGHQGEAAQAAAHAHPLSQVRLGGCG